MYNSTGLAWHSLALLLFIFGLACSEQRPLLRKHEAVVKHDDSDLMWPASEAQQRLRDYLHRHPQQRTLLKDVRLLLDAEQAVIAEKRHAALLMLQHAFAAAQGTMQTHILGRYLQVLADMQSRARPLFFYEQQVRTQLGYTSETLAAEIAQQLQGRLALARDDFQPPPRLAEMLRQDPTLEIHAQRYCQSNADRARWQPLLISFDVFTKIYWQALTYACLGQMELALENYQLYLQHDTEEAVISRPQFVLTAAAGRVAAGRRLVKSRAWQARAFIALAEVWQRAEFIDHTDLNMTRSAFLSRQSNDFLWAARAVALMADYEQAEALAKAALRAIEEGLQLAEEARENFTALAAEAYHVLAFRIEVERQNYQQAIVYSDTALQYQLAAVWQQRTMWHKGLYHYLAHDWQGALTVWQTMLQQFPASSYKAQLLFWLAKVTQQLLDESEAGLAGVDLTQQVEGYLARLAVEHPLSYYTVAAAQHRGWYEQHRVLQLEEMLAAHTDIDIVSYRQHEVFGSTLQRAEILISLQLLPLAQVELRALEDKLAEQHEAANGELDNQAQSEMGLRLYLSRLYAAAEDNLRSIVLTTRLAREHNNFWQTRPEQLLIYYPRPYLDIYTRAACHSDIEVALLLAVSRQESAFNANARGGAQEFGLMQLLPSTALRVAEDNDIAISEPAIELLTPTLNIKLGALYLRSVVARYPHNLPAAVAAYNAGEEAADVWTQRRSHADPLVWIELIAFGSTRTYVKHVQRNLHIYRYLLSS